MPRPLLALLALLALVAFAMAPLSAAAAPQRLTVLLDWFVNPDHAPLIVAEEKEWFDEAGLDVELLAPADPNDPPKLVAAKRADLAVSYQPQLHLQVGEGLPLVRVGTLVSTPLNSLVVLADGPIRGLPDLKGRKVGFSVGGFEDALLGAMLGRHGLGADAVELVNVNFALSPALISGQVDAVIGAFRNFELNQLAIEGRPGRAFFPEEEGVPAYDELIFVAHRDRLDDPSLVAFLETVERASLWLLNNPDAGWEAFKGHAPELDDALNARAWKDTLPRLSTSPMALDTRRYARFAAFLEGRGLVKAPPPVGTYAVDLGAR